MSRSTPWVVAAACAVIWIAPILHVHRASPRTLVSAHGLLHTAVCTRIQSDGIRMLPPENPFFAGESLPYYWFFHLVGAGLAWLAGIHPLHAFEWMILTAMALVWFVGMRIGRLLFGGILPGVGVGLLAVAGTNPFGAGILLLRVARYGTGILEDSPFFWGIVHPMIRGIRYNDPHVLHGPIINFFFNITSRPIALVLLLAVVAALLIWLETRKRMALGALVVCAALCTAFSFLVGVAACVSLALGLLGLLVVRPHESETWPKAALQAALALMGGALLASPTYVHFFLGSAEQEWMFRLSGNAILTVAASGLPIILLAALGVRRAQSPSQKRGFLALTIASVPLIAGSVLLVLPVANECNLFHAACILLVAPAVGGLVPPASWSGARVAVLWTAVIAVFVSTPVVVFLSYRNRPPVALEFRGADMQRTPTNSSLARLYAWIDRNTEPRSVFILPPGPPSITACGNMPELPALTGRLLFTSEPESYLVAPHRDAPLRHQLALALLAGERPTGRQVDDLDRFERPIYLVSMEAHEPVLAARLFALYGDPLFRDRSVAVYTLDPVLQQREPRAQRHARTASPEPTTGASR